jgi:uncharacterized protein (DUF1501 family)
MARDPDLERTLKSLAESDERKMDSPAAVVRQSTRTALEALEYLRERVRGYQSQAQYGNDPFARGLQQAAQIIATSPHTRILYVSVNGFDTHAGQATTHQTTAWSIR